MIWQACGRRGSGNQQKGFDVAVFVRMGLQVERPGGAWEKKKSCGAPPAEKKQGRREKIRVRRGMGSKRKPVVPRRQRKNREEERKVVLGGAWRAKRSLWCPAVKEKTGKKRENPGQAGHEEQKEALIPRLPSTCQPEIRELL